MKVEQKVEKNPCVINLTVKADADEIKNDNILLVFILPQTPSQLLDKDDWRLCRPYQKHLIDFWNVNTLIEDVNGEDVFQFVWIFIIGEPVDCILTGLL